MPQYHNEILENTSMLLSRSRAEIRFFAEIQPFPGNFNKCHQTGLRYDIFAPFSNCYLLTQALFSQLRDCYFNYYNANSHSCFGFIAKKLILPVVFGDEKRYDIFARKDSSPSVILTNRYTVITSVYDWIGGWRFSQTKRAVIITAKIEKCSFSPKPSYDIFARKRRYVLENIPNKHLRVQKTVN